MDLDHKVSHRLDFLSESDNESCELLRDADQSYVLEEDLSMDKYSVHDDQQRSMVDYNLSVGQCSLLELPVSVIAEVTDLELNEELIPGYLSEVLHVTSAAWCCSCSRNDLYQTGEHAKPGSRMSVYFPDKTGVNLSSHLTRSERRDSLCYSISSDDSGACDINDILPSSHECSEHYDDKHPAPSGEHWSIMDEVTGRLTDEVTGRLTDEVTGRLQSSLTTHTVLDQNNTSFEVLNSPIKDTSTSYHLVDKLTAQVDARHMDIKQMSEEVDAKFNKVRCHLESTREYYHELVEQWYWKNIIILEREQQQVKCDQEQQATAAEEAIAEIKHCLADIDKAQQEQASLVRYVDFFSLRILHTG
jgi:hypothetical protein